MRGFLALLRDSFRQALDQKALIVLLIFGGVLVLLCASIRFQERTPAELAASLVDGLEYYQDGMVTASSGQMTVEVTDVKGPDAQGRVSFVGAFDDTYPMRFAHEAWKKAESRKLRRRLAKDERPPPYERRSTNDVTLEDVVAYMRHALAQRGATTARVDILESPADTNPADKKSAKLRIEYDHRERDYIAGAHEFSLFFGATKLPVEGSKTMTMLFLLSLLADFVVGTIGVMVALIVTAGFVPDSLRRGRIDFLLTRPISRAKLLLGKYFGGLAFVAILAIAIIGSAWFVLSASAGIWSLSPLLTAFVLVFFFAIIYAASVCAGVITNSTTAVTFMTLGFWMLCSTIGKVDQAMAMGAFGDDLPVMLEKTVGVLHDVLPRTADMGALNQAILRDAYVREGVSLPGELDFTRADAVRSLAVSSAWIAFFLAFAWWRFRRRDY